MTRQMSILQKSAAWSAILFRVCGISFTSDAGTGVGRSSAASSESVNFLSESHSSSALRSLEGSGSPTGTDVYIVKLMRAIMTRGMNVKPPRT